MGAKSFLISAVILLACFAMPQVTLSADLAVAYTIDTSQSDGETVEGTMTVTVFNLSGGDLKNVDLRLDLGGPNALPRGVLQFGLVPAGGGGVAPAAFQLDQGTFDAADALPWRVDYDDMAGNHGSIVVIATRSR